MRLAAFLLLACPTWTLAQDDLVRVTSPNGQIEFQLFIAVPPEAGSLPRLAYRVFFQGKRLMDTSFLGLNIHNQEPLLGEKVGLISSKNSGDSLLAEYLQNGSTGRRLNLEVRAYDDGVAFRYVVPKSALLDEILIENEATEFQFVQDVLARIPPETLIPLPFFVEQPGVGWVAVTETHLENYALMRLQHSEGRIMNATLSPLADNPKVAVVGRAPLTSPWRVLMIGSSRARLIDSNLVNSLNSGW